MKEAILQAIADIEKQEEVNVFYACESGSRAWGFPSSDSDYDVRFLYVRPRDWYLSVDLEFKRDVIERPINDALDVSGWDVRKALQLLRKSNPPLLEWLTSPIVYKDDEVFTRLLQELIPKCYSRSACMFHYLNMARGNFREYLRGDIVWVKKYFYVLRPLLAIRWLEERQTPAPVEFSVLVRELVTDAELKNEIDSLVERKRLGEELRREGRIEIISRFIESELSRLESLNIPRRDDKPEMDSLNSVFREVLVRDES
ncbi:MAG: nucleotidyltransferase domain-containing protein [Pyrinomonadaceae bacterium]